MSKNVSVLGRGLGDLLEDNAPEVRHSGTVVRRDGGREVSISPEEIESERIIRSVSGTDTGEAQVIVTPVRQESAAEVQAPVTEPQRVEERPRTSLKAVLRSFKQQ